MSEGYRHKDTDAAAGLGEFCRCRAGGLQIIGNRYRRGLSRFDAVTRDNFCGRRDQFLERHTWQLSQGQTHHTFLDF